ncbi:hypothetical protein GUITHDRAFT_118427 [Guillardia theta CCMP2712]|uniref:PA14 domain-containing protein n=1 Tax=Guillardia theta (strain CCMP2712) TaxID=905079 RepID=L1IHK6_GUITC|nr:hypothetical protein GUITHDRAFT_118427 [Guillardia theta CCMP2712]EKX35409.1 hypothetical protein GUITHDRAFT_118427 [Guillardia theta CCMP2712]|eukprot:XP_005822389.1 hypothetical protein GUITHDRAFT_118427 [Guillardia theta CCMP2712]
MRRAASGAAAMALLLTIALLMQEGRREEEEQVPEDVGQVKIQHESLDRGEKELKWPKWRQSFSWPGRKGVEELQEDEKGGGGKYSRTQLLLSDDRKALALSRLARKNMQDLMREHMDGKAAIEGRLLKEEASRQIDHEEAQDLEAERLRSAIHAFEHGVPADIARKFSRVRSELKSSAQGVGRYAASSLKSAQRDFESALKGSMARGRQTLQSSASYNRDRYPSGYIDWQARYERCWPHCAPEDNVYDHIRTWKYPYDERHGGHEWKTWRIKPSGVDRAYQKAEQSGRREHRSKTPLYPRMKASAGFDMNVYWTQSQVDLQSAVSVAAGKSNVSLYTAHVDLADQQPLLNSVSESTNGLVVWSGFIFVNAGGEYTFTLNADSDSAIWIDHQQVTATDGGKGTATTFLLPGFHFFKAIFCKVSDRHVMTVRSFGPDTGGVEKLVEGFHDFNQLPSPQEPHESPASSQASAPHQDPDAPASSHSSFHHVEPEKNVWDHITDQFDSPSSGRRWSDPASDPQGYYDNVLGDGNDGDFVPLFQEVPSPDPTAPPLDPPTPPPQDPPSPSPQEEPLPAPENSPATSQDPDADEASESVAGGSSSRLKMKGKLEILHQLASRKAAASLKIPMVRTSPEAPVAKKSSRSSALNQPHHQAVGRKGMKQTSKLIAVGGWDAQSGQVQQENIKQMKVVGLGSTSGPLSSESQLLTSRQPCRGAKQTYDKGLSYCLL